VFAVCYPEVFRDFNIPLISIGDAKQRLGENLDEYNIYKYMWDNRWHTREEKAFQSLYFGMFGKGGE
jgi:hypothetical protein